LLQAQIGRVQLRQQLPGAHPLAHLGRPRGDLSSNAERQTGLGSGADLGRVLVGAAHSFCADGHGSNGAHGLGRGLGSRAGRQRHGGAHGKDSESADIHG